MTITELLELPVESLEKISDTQLNTLLAPYFTAARAPSLPEDKPEKAGIAHMFILDQIKINAAEIAKLQAAREKKGSE